MRIKMTQLVAAAAALTLAVGSAQAETIIYQDDFSGGAVALNGTTPDIGANNWVAGTAYLADGTIDSDTVNGGSATLAFTPVDGLVYTLDVSYTGVTGNANWLSMGFAQGQSSDSGFDKRFVNGVVIGRAWMIFRGMTTTNGNTAFLGSATNGTHDGGTPADSTGYAVGWSPDFPGGGDIDLRIELDTTGGAGNWTATWFAKRPTEAAYTEVRPEATLFSEAIDSVGLSYSNIGIDGNITSFSLTSVPEPGSLALLGLGGLLIARRRRD